MAIRDKLVKIVENLASEEKAMLRFFGEFNVDRNAGSPSDDNKTEINSWEKWFQFELLCKLRDEGVDQINYEVQRINHAGRKNSGAKYQAGNKSGFVDITCRFPKTDTKHIVGIELKTKKYLRESLRGGINDLRKFNKFKKTEWIFRAVYVISVFRTKHTGTEKFRHFLSTVMKSGWEEDASAAVVEVCMGEHFKALIFGWEMRPRTESLEIFRMRYGKQVRSLASLAKRKQILKKN